MWLMGLLFIFVVVFFCEQRNTMKRMCIKTLPPLLVHPAEEIRLRALKFDDYFKVSSDTEIC